MLLGPTWQRRKPGGATALRVSCPYGDENSESCAERVTCAQKEERREHRNRGEKAQYRSNQKFEL